MSTRNQRSGSKEGYWRTRVRQWRRSGLSVRDFCAEHGLSEPSFYAWRRTLAARDAEAVRLVPVRIVAEGGASPQSADPSRGAAGRETVSAQEGLELVLGGGRVLRIGPGFDAATLRRVLPLLEEGRPCS